MYINPRTKIHASFSEVREHYDKNADLWMWEETKPLTIEELAQGSRNLIVGEPGIGKTELLKKIQEHFDKQGARTNFISLRLDDFIERAESFINEKSDLPKILLLDALDETKANLFPAVLQKIEDLSKKYPNISIFLSARWVFISKYASSFPSYRFITISPFTNNQVKEYLLASGY